MLCGSRKERVVVLKNLPSAGLLKFNAVKAVKGKSDQMILSSLQ